MISLTFRDLSNISSVNTANSLIIMMGGETARGKEKEESAHVVMTENDTANVVQNMAPLGIEARNCEILDCACSSIVGGKRWLHCYLDSSDDY